MNQWTYTRNCLPDANKDIIGIGRDGKKYYVYLCGFCKNDWRDSITGGWMTIGLYDIEKWKYESEKQIDTK